MQKQRRAKKRVRARVRKDSMANHWSQSTRKATVWNGFIVANLIAAGKLRDILINADVDPELSLDVQQKKIALLLPEYIEAVERLETLRGYIA